MLESATTKLAELGNKSGTDQMVEEIDMKEQGNKPVSYPLVESVGMVSDFELLTWHDSLFKGEREDLNPRDIYLHHDAHEESMVKRDEEMERGGNSEF